MIMTRLIAKFNEYMNAFKYLYKNKHITLNLNLISDT